MTGGRLMKATPNLTSLFVCRVRQGRARGFSNLRFKVPDGAPPQMQGGGGASSQPRPELGVFPRGALDAGVRLRIEKTRFGMCVHVGQPVGNIALLRFRVYERKADGPKDEGWDSVGPERATCP